MGEDHEKSKWFGQFFNAIITGIIVTVAGGLLVNYMWDYYKNNKEHEESIESNGLGYSSNVDANIVIPPVSDEASDLINLETTDYQDSHDNYNEDSISVFEDTSTNDDVINDSGVTNENEMTNIVEKYLNGFVESLNHNDFTYLEGTLVSDSPIYKEQKKYVETKKASEELISFEIIEQQDIGVDFCKLVIYEEYRINNYKSPQYIGRFENTYTLKKEDDQWLFYNIISVNALSD